MSRRVLVAVALALALAWPAAARAHGVTHEVERRGDAWAVRVRYHGGKPLAGASYQVIRPGSVEPVREGKTGADGWVELVPDVPGNWRVRIADRTGHGRVVVVEVSEVPTPTPTTTTTTTTTTTSTPTPSTSTTTSTTTSTSTSEAADGPGPLRIIGGAAAVLAVFVALWAVRRRRGARP